MDHIILRTTLTFDRKCVFDQALMDMGPMIDWEVFPLDEDKRMCSRYGGCAILFHECLLCIIWYRLPFNEFEVGVLNHSLIASSQLHPVSWAFVKVFQHWCEYKGGKLTMMLVFHLFKIQNNPNHENGSCLLFLRQHIYYIEAYSKSIEDFDGHFYLVTLWLRRGMRRSATWNLLFHLLIRTSSISNGLRDTT